MAVSKGLISERTENGRWERAYSSSACREVKSALIVVAVWYSHARRRVLREIDLLSAWCSFFFSRLLRFEWVAVCLRRLAGWVCEEG